MDRMVERVRAVVKKVGRRTESVWLSSRRDVTNSCDLMARLDWDSVRIACGKTVDAVDLKHRLTRRHEEECTL